MKKIILFAIFLICACVVKAQNPTGVPQLFNGKWYKFNQFVGIDSALLVGSKDTNWLPRQPALVFWQHPSVDTGFWVYNGKNWNKVGVYIDTTYWNNKINKKQDSIKLTTIGTSGVATLTGSTLNIPNYGAALSGYVPYVGATGPVNLGPYDLTVNGITVGRGLAANANSTVVGRYALGSNTTGVNNTAIGYGSMQSNTAGYANTAIGGNSLTYNTIGYSNTSNGVSSMYSNTEGYNNTAIGVSSLRDNQTGINNTSIGFNSLNGTRADNNTAIGAWAGFGVGTNANTYGTNNIFIGHQSVGVSSTESNRTWIGNSSTTSTWLGGNLLVGGTTNNGYKLEVTGTSKVTGVATYGSTLSNGTYNYTLPGATGTLALVEDTISLSNRINLKLNISDTAAMLSPYQIAINARVKYTDTAAMLAPYLRKLDTASLSNRINLKQNLLTLTTTGTSGAATLTGATLNIPQYQGVLTNPITGTGTPNTVSKFTGTGSTIGDSHIKDDGTVVTVNATAGSFGALQVGNYNGNILMNTTSTSAGLIFQNTASSNKLWDLSTPGNDFAVDESNTGAAPRMYFKAGGHVLINSTSDDVSGGQLQVNGPIQQSSVTNSMLKASSTGVISAATSGTDYGTVTSVGLSMPVAFNVSNSPITSTGTIAVTGAGTAAQYIRGDGQLATLPSGASGGSSIDYYLNGGTSQGTIGGSTYYEMSRTAVIGTNADFNRTNAQGNGLITQFITDVADPNRTEIPAGSWNFELFFNASSSGGSPSYYIELLKYDGINFTSIANGSAIPELITSGTTIDLYLSSLAIPYTTLAVTDRLVIRVYVVTSGRTITLHTQDGHLCLITTTFAGGVSSLNGLTANTQYLAVGTAGSDFAINSLTDTHTFNLPTASATKRGALSSSDWSAFNGKMNYADTSSLSNRINTKQNTITLTTTGTSGAATFSSNTLNIPNYGSALSGYVPYTGATGAVNLGTYGISSFSHNLMNTGSSGGALNIQSNGSTNIAGAGYVSVSSQDTSTLNINYNGITKMAALNGSLLTTSRTFTFPNTSGTFALTSQLTGGTVTSVATGLGLSGGTITTSGTLLVDTSSASILSRQRAANTYQTILSNPITGSGSANYHAKFTSTGSTIGQSLIWDNGTNVGIGNTNTSYTLDVTGTGRFSNTLSIKNSSVNGIGLLLDGTAYSGHLWALGDGITTNTTFSIKDITSGVEALKIASTGAATFSSSVNLGSIANSSETSLLNIKQSSTAYNNGIYIERGGERNGYFMYIGGALDALTFRRNYFGTQSDVMSLTRDGNVGIGTTSPSFPLTVNGNIASINSASNLSSIYFTMNATPASSYTYIQGDGRSTGYMGFVTGDLERMRITSGGNVGIGTTSPSYALDIQPAYANVRIKSSTGTNESFLSLENTGGSFYVGQNNSVGNALITPSTPYAGVVSTNNANPLVFGTNGIERMRITSGGNVGIGTTSPNAKLQVEGQDIYLTGNTDNRIRFSNYGFTGNNMGAAIGYVYGVANTQEQGNLAFYTNPNYNSTGSLTARMTITSGGDVLMGTISSNPAGANTAGMAVQNGGLLSISRDGNPSAFFNRQTSDGELIRMYRGGTQVGNISVTTSVTSYNVTSDYRLKQDFKEYDGLSLINKIKTYDYQWKIDKTRMYGVLAHELQEVIPYAVQGVKDAEEMQSVDYSKLVPVMVNAIKELSAKNEALIKRIETLENK